MSDDAARRTVPGLARARTIRDMTQGCLADAAGVSEKTVRRAEAGQPVSPETRMALKAVLGDALDEAALGTHEQATTAEADAPPRRRPQWSAPPSIRRGAAAMPVVWACLALALLGHAMRHGTHRSPPPGFENEDPGMRLAMRLVAFDKEVPMPDTMPPNHTIRQVDATFAREFVAAATKAGGIVGPVNDLKTRSDDALLLGQSEDRPYLQTVGPGPCTLKSDLTLHDGKCGHFEVFRSGARLSASKVSAGLLLNLDSQDVSRDDPVFDEAHPEAPKLTKSGAQAFVPDGSGMVAMARMGRNLVIVDALPGGS